MRVYLYLRMFPLLGTPLNHGMQKAVHGLASGLVTAGGKVTVLCEGPEAGSTQAPAGYDIRCFFEPHKKPQLKLSDGLVKFVEEEMEAGLVVLNGIFNPGVGTLARLLHRKEVAYVVAPHDPYHPEIFRKSALKKWTYWYLVERPMLRRAAAVQVLDERHRDHLRMLNVATPVISLPNGFLPEEAAREPSPMDQSDARFIFLGRMDAHNKGLDLLLTAFGQLTGVTNARLTLQGPGTIDRATLEKQASSPALRDRVRFLDPDYSRSSPEVVSDHHVFCLPSRFEGFGLAALEAMLAARPVLVSDVGGIAPYVRASRGGMVVAADVKSIREGLREMLKRRDEWPEMGRRAREYVLQNLKWETIGASALSDYRRLCGGFDETPKSEPQFKKAMTEEPEMERV